MQTVEPRSPQHTSALSLAAARFNELRGAAGPPIEGGSQDTVSSGGRVYAKTQRLALRRPPATQEAPHLSHLPLQAGGLQQGQDQLPRPLLLPGYSAQIEAWVRKRADKAAEGVRRMRGGSCHYAFAGNAMLPF